MSALPLCLDDRRRAEVRRQRWNGLDYLEVSDDQLRLTVYFLGHAPDDLTIENVRISGGRRIRDIRVVDLRVCPQRDPELDNCIVVTVDRPGDFSTYTLSLVELPDDAPFDPRYRSLDFTFKAGCPTALDCAPVPCAPEPPKEPEISYLAKDYASFRRLILDRLSVVMPGWTDRHVPDLGVTLVELLAYTGDYLSYQQDAVATEAYLGTARQRISIRRHARLVDYAMHEGCNARAWVHVHASADVAGEHAIAPADLSFLTGWDGMPVPAGRVLTWDDLSQVPAGRYEVFEPLVDDPSARLSFWTAHNEIPLYTWGDAECCLPRGATSATLVDGPATPPEDPRQGPRGGYEQRPRGGKGRKQEQSPRGRRPEVRPRAKYEDDDRAVADRDADDREHADRQATDRSWSPDQVERPRAGRGDDRLDRELVDERDWDYDQVEDDRGQEERDPRRPRDQALIEREYDDGYGAVVPGEEEEEEEEEEGTRVLHLRVGDVLILEEIIGPGTGDPDDADPARRHAVRLTRVEPVVDALYGQPLLEVEWSAEDALPFPLCLSVIGPSPKCAAVTNVSVARGNVVLADHGRRRAPEALGCVPVETVETTCEREGRPSDVIRHPGRFRPVLAEGPLTFSQPLPPGAPATRLVAQDPRQALPAIRLSSRADTKCGKEPGGPPRGWTARPHLLASGRRDDHYVVEMDDRARAHLRFGDGEVGRLPEAGLWFQAGYRVGNGPAGNVGANAIILAVTHPDNAVSGATLTPRNPLPARGGTDPEALADVRLFAPYAFRQVLERAITPADYAQIAGQHPGVQRAAATLRWNGSWYEARVAVDPLGRADADDALLQSTEDYLYRYRRIGHDLDVRAADYVPLDLALQVCVKPSFQRGHVQAALLERFGTGHQRGGAPGWFNPDQLTFGTGVSLSRLVAAAQAIPGVESVAVTRLERLQLGPNGEVEQGHLPIGPLEIARLDSDPSFPENGRIRLDLRGGR
jgi:predicted phage baseplate assembly protein